MTFRCCLVESREEINIVAGFQGGGASWHGGPVRASPVPVPSLVRGSSRLSVGAADAPGWPEPAIVESGRPVSLGYRAI